MNKINIYGDYKVCIKCKDPADVIEGTKDYCIECWHDHVNNGKSFKEVDKQIKEEERFIKKKWWKITQLIKYLMKILNHLF